MHFVYKTDNLFWSNRVSYGNSPVTKEFHFLELIWTPYFLCVQNATFKATSSIDNPLRLHMLFFMHLLIILSYKTIKLKKHLKWTLKRFQIVMVSSFHPHSMCKKVQRLTAKIGCTSCTKQNNLLRSMRVSYENSSVTKGFHFFELIRTP